MTRRVPVSGEPLSRMRLRTGRELDVINVSNGGALVEGTARLLPGTHVDVHVVTRDGRVLVRSRVVRAYVSYLTGELVRYRGALAFERQVDTAAGYDFPACAPTSSAILGSDYPSELAAGSPRGDARLTA
jgi:hypothetical protein